MKYQPLELEVVFANKMAMQCSVVNVIARTNEGDIGILPGHEPLMAALVPCIVGIVMARDRTKILVIDGGLLTMAQRHIQILNHGVKLTEEILLQEAHLEAHELRRLRGEGKAAGKQMHRLHILNAQIRARERYQVGY